MPRAARAPRAAAANSEGAPKKARKASKKSSLKLEIERVAKRTGLSVIFIRRLLGPIKAEQKRALAEFRAAQAEEMNGRIAEIVSQRLNEIAQQTVLPDIGDLAEAAEAAQ